MRTITLEIQNDSIADRVLWMLNHFKNDGLSIKEENISEDVKSSIKNAVDELNMAKSGNLKPKPIDTLINAL